ncbi:unnamed protein product [Gongylonema pulchrum]|uniref:G_PROTEIN_RECEP_F1_2 domain-containing protein n=1 Tax=Gongylonema pulchrum TaxID=637853 RepID=A0A183DSQ1_9BILA|nr:unnamed protein product [Gongylonema pulchrum]
MRLFRQYSSENLYSRDASREDFPKKVLDFKKYFKEFQAEFEELFKHLVITKRKRTALCTAGILLITSSCVIEVCTEVMTADDCLQFVLHPSSNLLNLREEMRMKSYTESVSSNAVCRICHSSEQSVAYDKSTTGEPLISPCLCKRYRSFCEFITSRNCYAERRNLFTDITCFVILTPIVIGCIALCIVSSSVQTNHFQLWGTISGCQAIRGVCGRSAVTPWLAKTYQRGYKAAKKAPNIRGKFTGAISITLVDLCSMAGCYHFIPLEDIPRLARISRRGVCGRSAVTPWLAKTYQRGYKAAKKAPNIRGKSFFPSYPIELMRLLCFDFRSFLRDLCSKNIGTASSVNNPYSGGSAIHERRPSTISSRTLDINYNEFVRHLQPREEAISATSSSRYILASTPIPSETPAHVPIFDYPTVKRKRTENFPLQNSFCNRNSNIPAPSSVSSV